MPRTTAKICGITTPETLDAAIAGGASHVGFVFFPKSPRSIGIGKAAGLAQRAGSRVGTVGLFVDPDPDFVDAVRKRVRLDVVQLHGSERPATVARIREAQGVEVWKAVPVRTAGDVRGARDYLGSASRILFDAKPSPGMTLPGGNGLRFDWALLDAWDRSIPWALSGGLDPSNVRAAIGATGARLVDVSSGVESAPGIKDVDKIAAFLQAVGTL